MSYLVFARKFRPLLFEDVVGQEHITATLQKAIEKQRVAHAYIFSGTRGVGKTTIARILARALNCKNGPTSHPCGVCENCVSILNGTSFDVQEIDGASNNGVDNIRELRENITYASMSGKFRIYIIDEVHMLTKGAFNALLKTLEEPPASVIFIFATTEPQKIPDTIHSRCQHYDFKRITAEQIQKQLEKICTKEHLTFDANGLALVAQRADGSMRDALSLMDQVVSFCSDHIDEKQVRSVLGLVDTELYHKIFTAIEKKDPGIALEAFETALCDGYDIIEFVIGLQEFIRNALLQRIPGTAASKNATQTYRFSEFDLLRMAELLKKCESEIKWSSLPKFTVETTLFKLVYMQQSVSIEEILTALKQIPAAEAAQNEVIGQTVTTDTGKKKKLTVEDRVIVAKPSEKPVQEHREPIVSSLLKLSTDDELIKRWHDVTEALSKERPAISSYLSVCRPEWADEHSLRIHFGKSYEFYYFQISQKENKDFVQKSISQIMERSISIEFALTELEPQVKTQQSVTASPAMTSAKKTILLQELEQNPMVKKIMELFDAEII